MDLGLKKKLYACLISSSPLSQAGLGSHPVRACSPPKDWLFFFLPARKLRT